MHKQNIIDEIHNISVDYGGVYSCLFCYESYEVLSYKNIVFPIRQEYFRDDILLLLDLIISYTLIKNDLAKTNQTNNLFQIEYFGQKIDSIYIDRNIKINEMIHSLEDSYDELEYKDGVINWRIPIYKI